MSKFGLEGEVNPQVFETLLRGELSTGDHVGGQSHAHRTGIDLTLSMPKCWSLIALVGGDST
ncbi:MAG: relaxase domain-containing protein [Novosphingobium sp.]|nr:relaxase domain-containing protein [Novosphingobium sp.]